ncbi:MAG: GtrA family protein, partial [Kangiellaceae bacterium]|nr:GtrA family protein [Kangiellaceae bacterium]
MFIQLMQYNLVGVVNTLIGFSMIIVLMVIGVSPVKSNLLGYGMGALLSYYLNSQDVFHDDKNITQALRFFVVLGLAYGLNYIVLQWLIHFLNPYLAQFGAALVYSISAFILMKIVVIAPNVSENLSGEAIKAFQYITHMLANGDDVTLLTHARSRGHLDRFPDMLAVRFVEDGFWQKFFWRSRVLRSLVDVPFFLAVRKIIEGVYAEAPETVFHFLGPVSPIIP